MGHYRPPLRVSTAYRPCGNLLFSRSFVSSVAPAVGTGDVFLSLGESLLRMYPSAGTLSMHLASDYIHPYKSVGGRLAQCRATRFPTSSALISSSRAASPTSTQQPAMRPASVRQIARPPSAPCWTVKWMFLLSHKMWWVREENSPYLAYICRFHLARRPLQG
jgi:hypothetical protein